MKNSDVPVRGESQVRRDIHDARVGLRSALERVKAEANKVALRAERAVADLRNNQLTFHGAVSIDSLLQASAEIAPAEARLVDLAKELGALR